MRIDGTTVETRGTTVQAAKFTWPAITEQLEDSDLHRVVLKLRFADDPLVQRQHDVAEVERALAGAAHALQHGPRRGADPHRERVVLVLRAPQLGGAARDSRLP